jgi:uncharacterized protein (DUF4213/DUF364 family)
VLSEGESTRIAISLIQLTPEVCLRSEKIYELRNTIGKKDLTKGVCALLKMFSDSAKVNKPLSSYEIIMLADMIVKKYTHDSLADVAMALKEAIMGGYQFYGSVTIADVTAIIEAYFERKAMLLEDMHKELRDSNKSLVSGEIGAVANSMIENLSGQEFEIVSFTEMANRERRERVLRETREWRERLEQEDVA